MRRRDHAPNAIPRREHTPIRNPPARAGGSTSVPPGTESRGPNSQKTPGAQNPLGSACGALFTLLDLTGATPSKERSIRVNPVPRKAEDSVERASATRKPPPKNPAPATPSARPAALAGPPQSGRQRKGAGGCAGEERPVPAREHGAAGGQPRGCPPLRSCGRGYGIPMTISHFLPVSMPLPPLQRSVLAPPNRLSLPFWPNNSSSPWPP